MKFLPGRVSRAGVLPGMLQRRSRFLLLTVILSAFSLARCFGNAPASIVQFDQKARRGEPVHVVFLGGSLTWGANASDPQLTSYRGQMMRYLSEKYPRTPIHFHDASIGGSGSLLGLFRLQRDVLAYKPDLVFLDFTVNDNAEGTDVESLASYERIVRTLLASGSPVLPVLMCFKNHITSTDLEEPPRHQSHLKLAQAYGLAVADVLAQLRHKARDGQIEPNAIWNIGNDGAHPGDEGYELFFEIVRDAYEIAIAAPKASVIPEKTVFEDKYPKVQRQVLVDGALPNGWKRGKTYRTSLWFDGLSSRWMGDVATTCAKDRPEPLVVNFSGSVVGIFGEHNGFTPPIKISIDGKPVADPNAKDGGEFWILNTARFAPPHRGSGNLFMWLKIADCGDGEHTLRIEPIFDGAAPEAELHIESVCSAGR